MKEKTAKDVILVDEHAKEFVASDYTLGYKRTNTPASQDFKVEDSSDSGDKPLYSPIIGAVKHYERKMEKSGDKTEKQVSKNNNH